MSAQVSHPVYSILESPTARKGVESMQRERQRMIGVGGEFCGPKSEKGKWVGLSGSERVRETWGENMSLGVNWGGGK